MVFLKTGSDGWQNNTRWAHLHTNGHHPLRYRYVTDTVLRSREYKLWKKKANWDILLSHAEQNR